ncbi:MAG TPA: PEP/pyruvate-binding domain-containing protein, partial [Pseudonocardia sp.]|nr:PEP/pyruvate-binding domain-containing protein [Pseudonocardia sp.]
GGFCVTTAAYARAASGVDTADPVRARELLRSAPLPDDVATAVMVAYRRLCAHDDGADQADAQDDDGDLAGARGGDGEPDVPVAVRSSATAEDLPTASFAGQQDTYLNVVGVDALLDAVRRCWASLWTDRAVAYRADIGIDDAEVRLAVVVQRMVAAQVAGVLFTADPVSGRRTRAVLDASPGLGEAVVSGMVNPDHLAVEDGRVVDLRLGDKAVAVRALPGGGTERVELRATQDTGADGPAACVTDAQAVAVTALGRRVEAHFGVPQDIEWALDAAGTIWLTQARPITSLYPVPPSRDSALRAFVCASLAQGLTRPITPMGLAAFGVIGGSLARLFDLPGPHTTDPVAPPPAFAAVGGRVFVDVTAVLRNPLGRAVATRVLGIMEARTGVVLRELSTDPAFAPVPQGRRRALRRIVPVLVHLRVPLIVAQAIVSPTAARRRVTRIGARAAAVPASPPGAAPTERVDRATEALATAVEVFPRSAPAFAAGFLMRAVARRLAGADLDDVTMDAVLRALPYNVTTEMDLQLWALAQQVRADPASAAELGAADADPDLGALASRFHAGDLPAVLQDGLAAFLRRYGHRAVAEIDLGMPRWSEQPEHVLGVLANYLRLSTTGDGDPDAAPDARFAAGQRVAEQAIVDVVARVGRRSRWRARAVGFALGRVRALVGLREAPKDHLVRLIALARAELAAVGVELAARGLLDAPDDVFFCDLRDVRAAVAGTDQRARGAARREEYARELRRRHVPRVLLSDGTEPEALARADVPDDGALVGTPASAGTVTATARVVLDPVGARLEPGEVLVAPSTDPGWTPLFLTAGALVMEMGGANSHGAVVAREYGIPAVVGVPDATTRITTGARLTVDGAAGRVHLD